MIVGDVAEDLVEGADVVEKGGDHGWNIREGNYGFKRLNAGQPMPSCPDVGAGGTSLRAPALTYPHTLPGDDAMSKTGNFVVGGFVYRGTALTGHQGRYFFGDWSRDRNAPDGCLWVATPSPNLWEF